MRVVLTTDRVVGYGVLQRNGDVIEVGEVEAKRLLAAGQAVIETAMDEPREEFAQTRKHVSRRNSHASPAQ